MFGGIPVWKQNPDGSLCQKCLEQKLNSVPLIPPIKPSLYFCQDNERNPHLIAGSQKVC
jgi:hypothetical protein